MLASGLALNLALVVCSVPLISCAETRPKNLGEGGSALAACPSSPNCVSSDAADGAHAVLPLELAAPPGEAWAAALAVVAELPRTERGVVHSAR